MLKKCVEFWLLIFIGLLSPYAAANTASAADTESASMIVNRHHPEKFIQSIQNDPDAGKKIYQQFCSTCHDKDPSIDVGAPRIGVHSDWESRMKKGLDGLLAVTITGLNQMPPRGGCFECSDAQLKAALLYMLPSIKKTNKNK